MARLVEDLLLLARIDDHRLRIRRDDVDLDDLAYAERERISVEYPSLTVDAAIEAVRVTGDADALLRVLRNLVDNAAQHAATTLTLRVQITAGTAEVMVGNDGPPIAAADRERIFDRFVRLDDSRSRADGGTGLGLPIARDIIAAHGGTLTVDDLSQGAAMRIRLRLPDEADEGASTDVRTPPAVPGTCRTGAEPGSPLHETAEADPSPSPSTYST